MLVIIIKMSSTKYWQGWKTKLLQLKYNENFYHGIILHNTASYFDQDHNSNTTLNHIF